MEDYESGEDIDGSPGQEMIKTKWSKVYFLDLYQIKNPSQEMQDVLNFYKPPSNICAKKSFEFLLNQRSQAKKIVFGIL